ncbi:MAG: hypothetical protein HY690_06135 [Chloroflexi bacterium]|nr:hypothetical protein [Chloroflexota bacterium]
MAAGQYGRGRRTAVWDGCGRATFTWDRAGRLAKEERVLDGASYVTEWRYDALDRIAQLVYPNQAPATREVLTYRYGPYSLLTEVASSLGVNYVSEVQYNALNLPRAFTLGSSPSTTAVAQSYYGLDDEGDGARRRAGRWGRCEMTVGAGRRV